MRITLAPLVHEVARIFGKRSNSYPPKEAKVIIKEYFKEVEKAILNEQEFRFPSNVGTIQIIRKRRTSSEIKRAVKKSRNLASLAYDYSVAFNSQIAKDELYEFKISKTLGKKMYKEIVKGKNFTTIG